MNFSSPTRGGETLTPSSACSAPADSIVYRTLRDLWHIHRRNWRTAPHLFGYGEGLGAYIAKYVADPTATEMGGARPFPRPRSTWSGCGGGRN